VATAHATTSIAFEISEIAERSQHLARMLKLESESKTLHDPRIVRPESKRPGRNDRILRIKRARNAGNNGRSDNSSRNHARNPESVSWSIGEYEAAETYHKHRSHPLVTDCLVVRTGRMNSETQ
jgi:hypothetical protein